MSNELEETIKSQQARINKLETENKALLDIVLLVSDAAAGIMLSLQAKEYAEAMRKADILFKETTTAMAKAKGLAVN